MSLPPDFNSSQQSMTLSMLANKPGNYTASKLAFWPKFRANFKHEPTSRSLQYAEKNDEIWLNVCCSWWWDQYLIVLSKLVGKLKCKLFYYWNVRQVNIKRWWRKSLDFYKEVNHFNWQLMTLVRERHFRRQILMFLSSFLALNRNHLHRQFEIYSKKPQHNMAWQFPIISSNWKCSVSSK